MTDLIFLHRCSDYHPRRRPLGGGVVAGLPHRRHHHAHICHSVLVPAQIVACPCGPARSQLHAGANPIHQRLPKPGAQVQTGGASKPPADGQGCVNADCSRVLAQQLFRSAALHKLQSTSTSNCTAPAVLKAPAAPNEVTFSLHLKPFFHFSADFVPTLRSLFGNPVYIVYLCVTILQFNSLIGMVTYKPKYIEQHYGQSASTANFLMGEQSFIHTCMIHKIGFL